MPAKKKVSPQRHSAGASNRLTLIHFPRDRSQKPVAGDELDRRERLFLSSSDPSELRLALSRPVPTEAGHWPPFGVCNNAGRTRTASFAQASCIPFGGSSFVHPSGRIHPLTTPNESRSTRALVSEWCDTQIDAFTRFSVLMQAMEQGFAR